MCRQNGSSAFVLEATGDGVPRIKRNTDAEHTLTKLSVQIFFQIGQEVFVNIWHHDGCQPIAIGNLSDSGDQKI